MHIACLCILLSPTRGDSLVGGTLSEADDYFFFDASMREIRLKLRPRSLKLDTYFCTVRNYQRILCVLKVFLTSDKIMRLSEKSKYKKKTTKIVQDE